MKLKLIFLGLFLLLTWFPVNAQEDWSWVNPLPQGNKLNDVQYVNDNLIVMVGNSGTFLNSTDGGQEWKYSYGLGEDLNCLYFCSPQNGYVGGNNGLVLKTKSGGDIWEKINTDTNENILDIFFNSNHNSLFILTRNDIKRTTNDGLSWNIVAESDWFEQFDFPDSQSGWVCGNRIMKSTNGGINWQEVNIPYYTSHSLTFIDSQEGYLIVYPGTGTGDRIIKTTDGGSTWNEQYWPNFTSGTSILALSQDLAFCAAIDPEDKLCLYKTFNGGQQWNKILVYANDIWLPGIYDISFNSIGEGIAVGSPDKGNSNRQVLLNTSDWGDSWQLQNDFSATEFTGISIINDNKWILTGNSQDTGKIFTTTNSGNDWIEILNAGWAHYLSDININSSGFGVAAGTELYQTFDAGDTWTNVPGSNISNTQGGRPGFNSVFVLNDSVAWAAGSLRFRAGPGGNDWYEGALFKTSDMGENWEAYIFSDFNGINSVYFANTLIGWFCASNQIYFTSDGGNQWIENFTASSGLLKLKFWNEEIGFACGLNGTIIKTTDMGNSWQYQNSGNFPIRDLVILSDSESICVSLSGILTTLNGGNSWENPRLPVPYPQTIDYKDNFGIIAARQGLIIRFSADIINNILLDNKLITVINYTLSQNYPNPFNPTTKIKFNIPSVTLRQSQSDIVVTLKVYDLLGREVATLVNEEKQAGIYEVTWNAANLPSGVYFYRIQAGSFSETKKMILLK